MSEPTNILGKVGQAVGLKLKAMQDTIDNIDTTGGTFDGNLTGDMNVSGKITCGSLQVEGDTKVINTQTVEVSDNILELNKSDDNSATATSSGITINRGLDAESVALDKASVLWDNVGNKWAFGIGSSLANVEAQQFAVPDGGGFLINGVSVGTYADFEAQFNAS